MSQLGLGGGALSEDGANTAAQVLSRRAPMAQSVLVAPSLLAEQQGGGRAGGEVQQLIRRTPDRPGQGACALDLAGLHLHHVTGPDASMTFLAFPFQNGWASLYFR